MTAYRVGEEGATVFSVKGEPVVHLVAGQVVVPGSVDTPGSLADQHRKALTAKRMRGYADKKLRPTPPRRPDPRLSNCVLEGGRQKTYEDKGQ
ncbi:MAG TPA: hypothetical protein VFW27_33195 [Actinoplanes sp.]|nr:hypothetical protein [Actinoplanes sp.]